MALFSFSSAATLHRLVFRLSSRQCSHNSSPQDPTRVRVIAIGGLKKTLNAPQNPELVPVKYLPKDEDIPPETLKQLRWMMQKDLLGQDIFLIGRPSPLRRKLALQYLELTQRELEFVSLSRDTTESDLKQRREIESGTAFYIDQSAVRAARFGRVLVLEGIEKAERNVLPVLNNLLENREMHLEDGRLLIPASRYDKLLSEHSQEELDSWQLVRVSEDFRVIALGLPVPNYAGNPLDPPLRSRFQARDIRHLPFEDQLEILKTSAPNLSGDQIRRVLSFAHTLMSDEASSLGLPDFPIENLPEVLQSLNVSPNVSLLEAVNRLYPFKLFLPSEGCQSVEGTLGTFQLIEKSPLTPTSIESISSSDQSKLATVEVRVGKKTHVVQVPAGNRQVQDHNQCTNYIPTHYHESLLAEMILSHAVKDFCLIGSRGCGKSLLVNNLASVLGYDIEPVQLYQDMTARDLLQQRTTTENGDTIWRFSPLVVAAIEGKMAVLDGIHRIHRGTLAVLHRLIHDRELQLYDGTRLLRSDRYEAIRKSLGISDREMLEDKKILKIQENFRIVALAEPPTVGGSGKGQWVTPEILSMFFFHSMRPLSHDEELHVLSKLNGNVGTVLKDVLTLTHKLRESKDASLLSIASSLSTRQLLRVAKRLQHFPEEDAYQVVQKACLARFLPTLARDTLEKEMISVGMTKPILSDTEISKDASCTIENGILKIGTTEANLYNPSTKSKIPETLFYDTFQNISSMEALLRDFLLGEHLLLVGNQGVGKNKLVDRLLNLLNRPREYIQLHRDTTVQSLTLHPTVVGGVIVYEDSPLVKAVKEGHILVVDEADKAPLHVTCILKTLVESGEMVLSDGRRIVSKPDQLSGENVIKMHPDFRMFVLANRPGFPFLGNDFFASLGDLFSCHAIDNPSMEAELDMLRQYGPNVPDPVLRRLVKAFSELRRLADDGQINYPYSTREVVNIVKHLQLFPDEGLGNVVRNVFDFDSYDKEAKETLNEILHKHGIPIGSSPANVSLAREFQLSARTLTGRWERRRASTQSDQTKVQYKTRELNISGPHQVNVKKEPVDKVEARGLGFSEMQSYWTLPFHEFAVVGDVSVVKDSHNRPLKDKIHVLTSNPVWMYVMSSTDEKCVRIPLNHFYDTRHHNVIPKLRMAPMGGKFENIIAVHDEVTNTLLLVEPNHGAVLKVNHSHVMDTVRDLRDRITGSKRPISEFYRFKTDFCAENKLLFYTPGSNIVELMDFNEDPVAHRLELPMKLKSLHPLHGDEYLLVCSTEENSTSDNLFIIKKSDVDDPIPTLITPINQYVEKGSKKIENIWSLNPKGLTDFGLKMALNDEIKSPNTLLVTDDAFASVVMGFPDLEFSSNEVYSWPKESSKRTPMTNSQTGAEKYADSSRNIIFLRESCQIIKPVSPRSLPANFVNDNHGLSSPGNVAAYLEVVDLAASKLRYVPIPEPVEASVYASWYKKTYPDQIVGCAEMSEEGLVTVDNSGTVRLWETGVANLERSLQEWRQMIGDENSRNLMLQRDFDPSQLNDIDPKHGKVDPTGAQHVGGNTWAGGVGGRGTAGLGGVGGPYRLDGGNDVFQVSDEIKAQVPEEVLKAAREMNRKAYEQRLREIRMSQYDAQRYERFAGQVRKQVQALRLIISGLQAKAKDRQWLKNQTMGELDDTRLIEGITGEKSIYKKRGEQDPEPGAPQEKPKRLRLVVDLSGSMYRFNGHDQRLERSLESVLMVMEALDGYSEKFKFEIYGHSGEESALPLVKLNEEPKNDKERLEVLEMMLTHSQFCLSGDHTLSATVQAINDLNQAAENYDESFVIVLSDANFDRYGISPTNFAKILNRSDEVNAFSIFIGSLGDQADRLAKKLPSGKGFVCLETKKIPEIMKTIFTSTMLK